MKNDLSIYEKHADTWWSGETRWLRTLHKMAPARMMMIDPLVGDRVNKRVLDLGCGGGFLAEELSRRGAKVVGVDPSHGAIAAGVDHARRLEIDYVVGAGAVLRSCANRRSHFGTFLSGSRFTKSDKARLH